MSIWCRYLKINHITENVTCTVSEFACGRYIVVIRHILTLNSQIWLRLLFIWYIISFNLSIFDMCTLNKAWQILYFKNVEHEARHTKLLPKFSSRNYHTMLAFKPQQKTRDERGSNHVKSHWHFKRQRDDTFVWITWLFILLLPVRTFNLYLSREQKSL